MRALLGVGQRHRPANAARGSGDEGKTVSKAPRVAHGVSVDVAAALVSRGSGLELGLAPFLTAAVGLLGSVVHRLHLKGVASAGWPAEAGPLFCVPSSLRPIGFASRRAAI